MLSLKKIGRDYIILMSLNQSCGAFLKHHNCSMVILNLFLHEPIEQRILHGGVKKFPFSI